ncbi:alpha/beta hydrolase [Rhizobium sp. RU36D]|uniref:alpha/beta fold hydrolase n=1 Tax=Rhizobium sp. RU36D TaxID=1907415 RepID=UPI0009D80567|nr:alpha/beta hydrolase [Rhizobium sp. RU36D]SMC59913.1 Lysophospholipase, alpha-beta hydrolase superfamily [Rhizobium sp. RU36D]
MFSETKRFSSPSGALLAYHHQRARGEARGLLLLSHGMIEHSLRYEPFALTMAARGYHVYAHDHRGHGETTSAEAPLGRFSDHNGAEKLIEDLKAMRDMASVDHPGLPMLLLGHSMGGLIALNTAATHPRAFQGVAIWNSNFNTGLGGVVAKAVLRLERMLKGSDVPSGILPKATFDAWGKSIDRARTPHDWLSRDPVEVDKYASDPLCRFDATVSMWLDVVSLASRGAKPGMLARLPSDLPLHLVGGGKDPATRGGRDIAWLANRLIGKGFSRVTHRHYPDMRHETLNEIGREIAIEDFASWCDRIATLPAAPTRFSEVLSETE